MKPRVGPKLRLDFFDPKYASKLFEWYYNVDYAAFFREFADQPYTVEDFKGFGDVMAQNGKGFFVIVLREKELPIGLMTFTCLKRKSGVFRFGIMLETTCQNQIYAIEAIALLGDYLFTYCSCQKLVVEFLASDKHIKRITEKGGFTKEAVLKNEALVNGRLVNEVRYYILKKDFYKNAKAFLKKVC